jgi:hypothetical protein
VNRVVRAASVAALGLMMAGCAIGPKNPGAQSTRITFTVQLGGAFNPNYIYVIPMYISTSSDPGPPTLPSPTISGTPNGMFTGYTTDYVVVDALDHPSSPFQIFAVGDQADPGSTPDIPLGFTTDTIAQSSSGYPSSFSFSIFASQVAEGNVVLGQQLQTMSFQILAMNVKAFGGPVSGRFVGGLGQSSFQVPTPPLQINRSQTVSNGTITQGSSYGTAAGYTDPPNGDPSLQITGYSVSVSVPAP